MVSFSLPKGVVPGNVRIIMVCEAMPDNPADYFYTSSNSLYVTNTIDAFNSAGIKVNSIDEILKKGVYLTVAVKTARTGPTVPPDVIEEHSHTLEKEIGQFPNVKAILLMGDAAIRALNCISKRKYSMKAIPAGSTYKIRKDKFYFNDIRAFPSYLQTGKNFLIEKAKQRMVAEDIKNAFLV